MPEISAVQTSQAHGAISRAAAATGVDFDYLLAQARIESGLDAIAQAKGSSAAGLYQFINSTWLDTLDRHGDRHGLAGVSDAIVRSGGRAQVADPVARAQILAMRFDPDVSAMMAAELARDNAADLGGFLGRQADHAEMYLAHFLGASGARTFLGALQDTPQASAAALFPRQAEANPAIFLDGSRARTVVEVMELIRGKMSNAGSEAGFAPLATGAWSVSTASPTPHAALRSSADRGFDRQLSMADTLAATFSVRIDAPETGAARHVRAAYRQLKAFGL